MAIYTLEEILKNTGARKEDIKQVSVERNNITPSKQGVFNNIKSYLGGIKSSVQKAGAEVESNINAPGNPIVQGIKASGSASIGVGDTAISLIPGARTLVDGIGKVVAPAIQGIADNRFVQAFSKDLATSVGGGNMARGEEVLNVTKSFGDIANLPLGARGTTVTGDALVRSTKGVVNKSVNAVNSIAIDAPSFREAGNNLLDRMATENPVKLAKVKVGVANNLNEYAAEFAKSRKAINGAENKIDGFDYGTHIAERNLLPDVTDSGRFDGGKIIDGLKTENTNFGNQAMERIRNSQTLRSTDEFINSLKDDAVAKAGSADILSTEAFIDRFMEGAKRKYGITDTITDEQIYKIKLDGDSGYNYSSPNADINASKIIADRARTTLRSGDVELAKLLDAQTKNFEAIRITDALSSYKVKAGNLTTRLAQLGGSLLGANAVDGGIVSKVLAATIGGLGGQKLVQALQQSAFISPVARKAIEKELIKASGVDATKVIMKKIDNGINLLPKENVILEKAGNQLKSSIIKNDKTTAIKTSIDKSIPLKKKVSELKTSTALPIAKTSSAKDAIAKGLTEGEFVKEQGGLSDSIAQAVQKRYELSKVADELSKKANSFADKSGLVNNKTPEFLSLDKELFVAVKAEKDFNRSALGKIVKQEVRKLDIKTRMEIIKGNIKTTTQLRAEYQSAMKGKTLPKADALLFHGTSEDFSIFDTGKQKNGNLGKGVYLTDNKVQADYYAMMANQTKDLRNASIEDLGNINFRKGNVLEFKPKDNLKIKELNYMPGKLEVDKIKADGFDGVKYKDETLLSDDIAFPKNILGGSIPKNVKSIIIFDSNNVKSKNLPKKK